MILLNPRDKFDRNVVNQGAVQYAQKIVRKTQASSYPKDLPQAVSRGAMTGAHELDKMILQFQTFTANHGRN